MQIRDSRKQNWFWINKQVWQDKNLLSSDKVVYGGLANFVDHTNQSCYPSLTTLEEMTGLTRDTVISSLKHLVEAQYIEIEKTPGKPNIYVLLEMPDQSKNSTSTSRKNLPVTSRKNLPALVENKDWNNNHINKNIYITNVIEKKSQEKVPKKTFGNPEINEAIKFLRDLYPSVSSLDLNRFALHRLLKKHVLSELTEMMQLAYDMRTVDYCPVITNYLDLEKKWDKFKLFLEKQNRVVEVKNPDDDVKAIEPPPEHYEYLRAMDFLRRKEVIPNEPTELNPSGTEIPN